MVEPVSTLTVGAVLGGVIAFLKAIPIVDKWFQRLMVAYAKSERNADAAELHAGLKEAVELNDQRKLEKAIGNPHPGEPSGIPGTSTRPGRVSK